MNVIMSLLHRFTFLRFLGLFRTKNGALGQLGWKYVNLQSLRISGQKPVPWFIYGAIDFVEHTISPEAYVLELGGGASTAFWEDRGNNVVVIESDSRWAGKLSHFFSGSSNVKIIFLSEINSQTLADLGLDSFDVIVNDFDGDRSEVAEWMIEHLNPKGWIIWDNSDRLSAVSGISTLRQTGFGWVSFFGLGPINSFAHETSVYSRSLEQPSWGVRRKNSIEY